MSILRIVIVEDDPAVRWHFATVLKADPRVEIAAEYDTAQRVSEHIAREPIDVLLIDLGLPDADGIDVIRLAHRLQPSCDCIVVTVFGDDDRIFASLQAGATGYVLKDDMPADILACVHMVRAGGSPVSPSIARRVLSRFSAPLQRPPEPIGKPAATDSPRPQPRAGRTAAAPSGPLSSREVEILALIAKGPSVAEIAALLGLSPHTVDTHVKNIYRKLAVHSRTEAVFEGRTLGLLDR